MENELNVGIGNEEFQKLKPTTVKIVGVRVDEFDVKGKKSKKVVCLAKHPDKLETINISSVKFENKGKLESVGLWLNKDSQGLIRKGSALATLMSAVGANTPENLVGKEIATTLDDQEYLTFKAY